MTDMIIPNWHPIIVHFSVALMVTAAVVLILATAKGRNSADERLQIVGRMLFWMGAVALVLTVLAGLQAYYSVAHDGPSHRAMTNHRNWAFGAFALTAIASLFMWSSRAKALSRLAFITLLFSTGLVLVTAYKGGDLVYRYGLGVLSMPTVTGDGHDHDHGNMNHSHTAADSEKVDDHSIDCEEGYAPVLAENAVHEHADGKGHEHSTESTGSRLDPKGIAKSLALAIQAGDQDVVRQLLHEDVVVLESGHAQRSRDEYMNGHMLSDMAFLKNITSTVVNQTVSTDGDLAWVTTETHITGSYNGREIDEETNELLIMRNGENGWQVTHVHWGN